MVPQDPSKKSKFKGIKLSPVPKKKQNKSHVP